MSNKFFIRTYGCQMNVYDSELIAGHLQVLGYVPTDELTEADIVLVNTCTVRQHAENRALSEIGRLKHWKKSNPNRILIIAGCVASRLRKEMKHRFPQVDIVVPADEVEQFPQIFSQINPPESPFTKGGTTVDRQSPNYPITKLPNHQISSFMAISRGCSNYCAYCIVPYVRGEEKCRPVTEIVDEIKALAATGIKEVTLLGQNVNSYLGPMSEVQCLKSNIQSPKSEDRRQEAGFGNRESEIINFAELLRRVNAIEGIERIRFLTSHPKDLSDETINAIRDLDKVCEHIHLPVQSGSDRILELMNRKYTREYYLELVKKIRDTIPGVAISTDFVVGFPTETEDDFQQTLDLVNKVGFDFAYVFKYSPRDGTAAAKNLDDVLLEVKEQRLAKLLDLVNSWAQKRNQMLLNTIQEILVESIENDKLIGKTRTNRTVVFQGDKEVIGKTVKVKITGYKVHSLEGEMVGSRG